VVVLVVGTHREGMNACNIQHPYEGTYVCVGLELLSECFCCMSMEQSLVGWVGEGCELLISFGDALTDEM
jgi:hypothetical protein